MKAKVISRALLAVSLCLGSIVHAQDPLPSWNDTSPKKAIIAFVERVTKEGSPDFVRPEERIATFDNDGTLWAEKPLFSIPVCDRPREGARATTSRMERTEAV
jgi:hypothetical protein